MAGVLTNAERDAIDAFVRSVVIGCPEDPILIETTGEMRFPMYDPLMSEEELAANRQKLFMTYIVGFLGF